MILLDSDMITLLTAGHPKVVARVQAAADDLATTVVNRIEILKGRFDYLLKAADGKQLQQAQKLLDRSERDLGELMLVPVTAAAAAEFDRLRANKKLKNIGRADLLIASITLAHGATLVTRNLRHFRQISRLRLENWAD